VINNAGQMSHCGAPKIIYTSRTHFQLTQAMQELKRTAYNNVKAVSLGSRDQLCISPEVQKESGNSNKVHMCRLKVDTKQCGFYNRVEKVKDSPEFKMGTVVHIEDLVKFGQKQRACSYYLSRELVDQADIVFMPYNYLLDPKARKSQKLNLNNTIIILDEAHNIEKMCEESASVQIASSDIAVCIEDITAVMKIINENNEIFTGGDDDAKKDFTLEDLALLKEMMLSFEKAVDELEINFGEATFDGGFIFQLLQKANIIHGNAMKVSQLMDSLTQFLMQSQGNQAFDRRGVGLMKVIDFLNVVFDYKDDDWLEIFKRYFKVLLEPSLNSS
jgi:regulator of telomere elongation helicase 1